VKVSKEREGDQGGERGQTRRRWNYGQKRKERKRKRGKREQKKEEYDEVFKKSKLVKRLPSNREEKENRRGDGLNELITIFKELKKDLKEEMALEERS